MIKNYKEYKEAKSSLNNMEMSGKDYGDTLYAMDRYTKTLWINYAWGRFIDWMKRVIF